MKYVPLGRSGLNISRICVGTATFGVAPLEEDVDKIIGRAIELGVNFFDTADCYGNQEQFDRPTAPPAAQRKSAEELLGRALGKKRDDVIIASKVSERMGPGPNDGGRSGTGLSRYRIMRQVESSLRRLKTDRIDVYYAHRPDPVTPIDETLHAFNDLIHQGKILYYAVSKHTAWQMVDIMSTCDKLNLIPPICHQVPYSLADRSAESEVVPVCARYGIRLACYSPLAGGLLGGRSTARRPIVGNLRWSKPPGFSQAQLEQADDFDVLARQAGYEPSQFALAWLLSRPSVDTVICGAETLGELECDIASINIQLSEEDRRAAEEIFPG